MDEWSCHDVKRHLSQKLCGGVFVMVEDKGAGSEQLWWFPQTAIPLEVVWQRTPNIIFFVRVEVPNVMVQPLCLGWLVLL
jgi:hypothetical protein